jgi:hypothetical protein
MLTEVSAEGKLSKKPIDPSRNVHIAIFGRENYVTCEGCFRYIHKDSWKNHDPRKCHDSPYNFPKYKNKFFCQLGCGFEAIKRVSILDHYCDHHGDPKSFRDLRCWGLNRHYIMNQRSNIGLSKFR